MTTTVLAPYLTSQFFGNNGAFLSGGQLFTYQAGTVTPTPTYLDSTGVTPNTNPIVLNSRGECSIWLLPNVGYKFVLQDSSGNPIWTRDQVTQSQLLTLYGGVDTGIVNAYIINFTANFNAYTDGIVIYFVPAHTNTGASTINVNGLGVVSIVNSTGGALTAASILSGFPTGIIYKGGSFYLTSTTPPTSGSFTGTPMGFTTSPAVTVNWVLIANLVTLFLPSFLLTSNSIGFQINGLPAALQPATTSPFMPCPANVFRDNNIFQLNVTANLNQGVPGQINFITGAGVTWTNTGTKGINNNFSISYLLI